MKRAFYAIALLAFIAFITIAVVNIRQAHFKVQLKEIQLKDTGAQLEKLNTDYTKVLQQKEVDQKKLQELQSEKERLEKELQAKLERQEQERVALEKAAQSVSFTQTASASGTANCSELAAKLSRLGVTGAELDAAIILATRESSCRSSAVNASSGACGEFQSLPCGKWGTPGTDQYLLGAINYAKSRYGSYVGALNFSYANGWY